MNHASNTRSTFPYDDDREVIAGFLAGTRGGLSGRDSTASELSWQYGNLLWGPCQIVAWFSPTDNALMGKLLAGGDYHPGVLVIHAIANALGAPELKVTRESGPLEITAGGHKSAPVIGLSPDAQRHRFFFAGTPVQIDQPFLITGPMAITVYRAANKSASKKPLR